MQESHEHEIAKEMELNAERQSYASNLKILGKIRKHFADPQAWLDTPLAYFGGRRPRELLLAGEHKRLLSGLPSQAKWKTGFDDGEVVVS
jgi:hypothetical protein